MEAPDGGPPREGRRGQLAWRRFAASAALQGATHLTSCPRRVHIRWLHSTARCEPWVCQKKWRGDGGKTRVPTTNERYSNFGFDQCIGARKTWPPTLACPPSALRMAYLKMVARSPHSLRAPIGRTMPDKRAKMIAVGNRTPLSMRNTVLGGRAQLSTRITLRIFSIALTNH